MSHVFIIGPNFYDFNKSVSNAFIKFGWKVTIESFDEPIHPFKGWLKWHHKFSLNREKLKEKHTQKYQEYVVSKFQQATPDLVLILNGAILKQETLIFFRKTATVVLWMYDSVFRYPKCLDHIDFVDFAFFYEQKDVTYFKALEKKAYFLPQAADVNIYHPIKCTKKTDISFVGALYRYQKRIAYLTKVVEKFGLFNIKIIGKYKPIEKNFLKWLFREKRGVYTNRNISPTEVNKVFNQSRIVINIHHETQTEGANPKVFEICASGAYQICDYNPFIASIFTNNEVGLYKNEQELFDLIEDALNDDKSKQAYQAREIVIQHHSFVARVKEILGIISFTKK